MRHIIREKEIKRIKYRNQYGPFHSEAISMQESQVRRGNKEKIGLYQQELFQQTPELAFTW